VLDLALVAEPCRCLSTGGADRGWVPSWGCD